MQKHLLLILIALCCLVNLRAGERPIGSLSGTYLVGSSQPTYKKLTDVAAVLNTGAYTVAGNVVFELDSDYDGTTGETFPIVFNQFNTSGSWTVTIRPKAGVTMRTTSGNPGADKALITLNGTDRIIFDGRAGSTGSIAWLIRNTATVNAGATVVLKNDAKNNKLTYLQLEGQTASAGVVHFSTSGPDGNDDNTVSYCAIRDRTDVPTPARPATAILSLGSEASTGNIFDHNNIFNFYNNGASAYGIRLAQGTTDVSITYNSIYQEQALLNAASGTRLYGIHAGEWNTDRLKISDNFIGGSAPQCGGAPWTIASIAKGYCTMTGIYYGIMNAPLGDQNVCNHNTVRNIAIAIDGEESYTVPAIFAGLYANARMDMTNNIIGNPDGHDDIKITIGSGTDYFMACMIMLENVNKPGFITGNKVGGITVGGKRNGGYGGDLSGIYVNASGSPTSNVPLVVSDNIVGSLTIPDNIRGGDSLPIGFLGIQVRMPNGIHCINNTVAGVDLKYAGTNQPWIAGIDVFSFASGILVKNNLVAGISSASLAVASPRSEFDPWIEVIGIQASESQGEGKAEVSGNTVRGLHLTGTAPINTTAGTYKSIAGISLKGAWDGSVYNNRVYGLSSANDLGASSATMLLGICIDQFHNNGNLAVYNNLVSLDNEGLVNNCMINGLQVRALMAMSFNKLYHNTIYVGGSGGNSSNTARSTTLAYSSVAQYGGKVFFSIRNNLLVNERTGGSGGHHLFGNETPGDNWTADSSDTNVLITASMNNVGRWGASDLDSTQWKTTGGDAHSSFYTIAQIAPAALFTDVATGDLGIKPGARAYVIGKGSPSAGITKDYGGETRSTTAPSVGAYEYLVLPNTAPVVTSHNGNAAVTMPVPENTTLVTTMTATDTGGGSLVYSLAGGEDVSKFTVDPATGEVSFIIAPDFEQPGDANGDNAYIVTVQVSDGDSTAIQRFKVKITDANDHAPVITSYNGDAGVTLPAPEHTTTVIATVTATDVDKNTTITYSLVNEEDATQFGVNPSTGELSFVTPPPDFEHPADANGDNVYIVTVKASDGDSSATQRFKIKLTNINDNTPVITSYNGDALVSIQLPENTIQVTTVTATDGDSTPVTYSVLSQKDGALFTVNPSTGELSFITAPDFEHPADANSDNTYLVTVQASDGSLSAVQRFSITITDLADNPPVATMTIRVPENTVEVTPLEGSDADAGTSVTFTMVDKEDGALFWLNPANGALEFKTAPDFENPADANHDNTYLVAVKMIAGENITILRFQVKVTAADEGTGRTTGRNTTGPEIQSTIVLQMEAEPEPGKDIKVYPNPVTGKRFNLRMDSIATGQYTLELYTMSGQLACKQDINHTGKSALYPVQLPGSLARGIYLLKLAGANLRYTEKLLVE